MWNNKERRDVRGKSWISGLNWVWIIVIFVEIEGNARGPGLEGKVKAVLKVLSLWILVLYLRNPNPTRFCSRLPSCEITPKVSTHPISHIGQ